VAQRDADHRAQAGAPAGLAVDAVVGLAVGAVVGLARAQGQAGQAAVDGHAQVAAGGGGADHGAVDHVVAVGQLDDRAVGLEDLAGLGGHAAHRVVELAGARADPALRGGHAGHQL
jgi:hypothetical protein